MDKIKTDDLLVKILSFLPTKDAVTTSILSKRWKFLWMWVSKLEYNDHDIKPYNLWSLRHFVKRTLPLHKLPVLDSLRLTFSTREPFEPEDITLMVEAAVSRSVRVLTIDYSHNQNKSATLPLCLYNCKWLEILTLFDAFLMDVPRLFCLPSLKQLVLLHVKYLDESFRLLDGSRKVCFPSLKNLCLTQVDFFDEESLPLLLANCPDLERLTLERYHNDNVGAVSIKVPSLKKLSLHIDRRCPSNGVEIVAPSLTFIMLGDYCNSHFLIKPMPKLEEADIEATNIFDTEKFLGSFTSTKRLSLCLKMHKSNQAWNIDAICFNQLESLKICTRHPYWSILLVRLLKGSPKLKVLELCLDHDISTSFAPPLICWDQLNLVPECLLTTSLETFKWTDLPTTQESRDMVSYITRISPRLKPETTGGTWFVVGL